MSRAAKRPRTTKTVKAIPLRKGAKTAPGPSRGRQAGMIVCAAMLTVLLGGLGGAHLALTSVSPDIMPAARPVIETRAGVISGTGTPEMAVAVSPDPVFVSAVVPDELNEAAMARIYEEPLGPAALIPVHPDNDIPAPAPARVQPQNFSAPNISKLIPARRPALWQRYAVPVSVKAGQPMIAVVLDDVGLSHAMARRAIQLPGPLTLSFMTYAKGLRKFTADARAAGHELLLHVPMEPSDAAYDAGPRVLRNALPKNEIAQRLAWGLDRFEGYVGINNHMGSKFTATPKGVTQVMRELRDRDLLFLDSVTSANSVAWKVAARSGVPFARRDVFIDHDWRDAESIKAQLVVLERIARQRGYAVGIGHPHRLTLDILSKWLPEARKRGIALVPISAIVSRQTELAQNSVGSAG